MFRSTADFCSGQVAADSIYALLHREAGKLFPDEAFADLFTDVGRRSVPPGIVAVVMVLQRLEGCSDREAVDRFAFDLRWKHAAGVDFDYPGFVHTVLVDFRARLARSARPGRIFEVTLEVGRQAGLVGRRRVLDSTPIYDAVATMDTVTLIRSAIRGVLAAAGERAAQLRKQLARDDDYAAAGKPVCDYDDAAARVALVDALAKDARACLLALEGERLDPELAQAAELLATVIGQDLDEGEDGIFRIARRVAKDRVISTVDPQARHGHKTSAHAFDGYKGHVGIDPDSELITATAVTPGNAGDAAVAAALLADDLPARSEPGPAQDQLPAQELASEEQPTPAAPSASPTEPAGAPAAEGESPRAVSTLAARAAEPIPDAPAADADSSVARGENERPTATAATSQVLAEEATPPAETPSVYGDAAYGAGELLDTLERAGAEIFCKVQPPIAPGGRFTKGDFTIDLATNSVVCPAGQAAPLRAAGNGRLACFGVACASCPLVERCTTAKTGRTIWVGPYEEQLARARARQTDPDWKAHYRATRPKVERKIGHLMRRRHGGRRARVRGTVKVGADLALLAAAVNLARLSVLGLAHQNGTWSAETG